MAVDQKLLAAIQNIMEADNQILREEMAALMDTKLEPAGWRLDAILSDITRLKEGQQAVIERLDRMEGDIAEIREDAEITRDAANRLLAWAEEVGESVRVPLLEKERKMKLCQKERI